MKELIEILLDIRQMIKQDAIQHKSVLNTKDAALYLGISESTLHKLCSERAITYTKPGGKLAFFRKEHLDEFLGRNPHPAIDYLFKKGGRNILNPKLNYEEQFPKSQKK